MSVADVVEQRGLTVIDVTHDYDYGSAVCEVLIRILAVVDDTLLYGDYYFLLDLGVELHSDQRRGIEVHYIVGGHHGTHEERFFDYLGYGRLEL